MSQLLLYSTTQSPRLQYIIGVFCNTVGITSFEITTSQQYFLSFNGAKINYSACSFNVQTLDIIPVNLLFENNIYTQAAECFNWQNTQAFFKTGSNEIPFDVFAASFYLLTRYEEYLPHKKDIYGRFAHTESLAFKQNFLQLPLINLWFNKAVLALKIKFGALQLVTPVFTYIPTYDIDIAWSYFKKGIVRNTAGLLRSILKRDWESLKERLGVLLVFEDDPFDIYEWLDKLHEQHALQPIYFFLVAAKTGRYDKNINPESRYFQLLISKLSVMYATGIHPSWQSGDDVSLLKQEVKLLEKISNRKIKNSRQHYIRMQLPHTYQHLINNGITKDFSMGYGSINGFRASYCMPYLWYNLATDQQTQLTVYPFCYMEANSIFEQKLTPEQALEEMEYYCRLTRELNGTFITIFHNHLLTEQPNQIAWRNMYQQFLEQNF